MKENTQVVFVAALRGLREKFLARHYKILVNYAMIAVASYVSANVASLFYEDILPNTKQEFKKGKTGKDKSGKDLKGSKDLGGFEDDSFNQGASGFYGGGFDNFGKGFDAEPSYGLDHYNSIFTRNIFNSKGIIPDADVDFSASSMAGPPVRTNAPIQLVGTIISENELRSLGAIQDRSNDLYAVRVNDMLGSYGRVTKIERLKVTFFNMQTQKNEFVELKEQAPGIELRAVTNAFMKSKGGVQAEGTNFTIDRSELDKQLKNLNQVLTEARLTPDPSGCWRIQEIVAGSLYDTIGLKNNDMLCNINGNEIDAGRAFEFLNELKTANHIDINLKREGKQFNHSYEIK